jgi:hypothetical protein
MQKIEKSKKKIKETSKESSNEKEETDLRKLADRMLNADMNHYQSDNYDESDSDVEPQIFSEHRDKDGNFQTGENDEGLEGIDEENLQNSLDS